MDQNVLFAVVAPQAPQLSGEMNCCSPPHYPPFDIVSILLSMFSFDTPMFAPPIAFDCLLKFCIPFWIRNWSHIATHLLVLLLVVTIFSLHRKRLRRFKSAQYEVLQYCSSSKYALIDGVRFLFLIWRHNFKIAAMTSFHAEKCCHLVSVHPVSAWCICCSVRQFLIHSIFIPYLLTILYRYFM